MVSYDSLEFPIRWYRSEPLHEHLYYVFTYYIDELTEYGVNKEDIAKIKNICNCILNVFSLALNNRKETAVNILKTTVGNLLLDQVETIESGIDLYRLRYDKENLKNKNDFMHVPFNKLFLCNSMRFSMPGEPCLYLGYSKDVCYKELGLDKGGSIGHFQTNSSIKVVDLTLNGQKGKLNDLFELWPILAACYVAPDNSEVNFKEEYIFPQIIMMYLKSQEEVDGLRYYSCRYPELNPTITDYMNIALFARKKEESRYHLDINQKYPSSQNKYDEKLEKALNFIQ